MHSIGLAGNYHAGQRLEHVILTNVLHLAGNIEYHLIILVAMEALVKGFLGILVRSVREYHAVVNQPVLPTANVCKAIRIVNYGVFTVRAALSVHFYVVFHNHITFPQYFVVVQAELHLREPYNYYTLFF